MALFGYPATIAFTQAQQEMHAAKGPRAIGSMKGEDALQFIVEKDGAEVGLQLFGNDFGNDFQGLVKIRHGGAEAVDALERMDTALQVPLHLCTLRGQLVHDRLVTAREGE